MLKNNFPVDGIVLGSIFDFNSCYIRNKQQIGVILDLIQGRKWTEVDWQVVHAHIDISDELVIASCLTTDAYSILFPSFLLDCLLNMIGKRKHNSYLLFVDWHLNLNNLKYNDHYEDKKAFLLSLSYDQKKCVALILHFMTGFDCCRLIAKKALDSYWIDFL